MAKALHSTNWHRVADIRPCFRSHAGIHRHHLRGQRWYILQDRTSGRFHRFTPAAYLLISLMDGQRSVQQIWDTACVRLGDEALTQDDVIQLLSQLYNANVLYGDVPPAIEQLTARAKRVRRIKRVMGFINPLAVRLPLVDPDRFLTATLPLVRPLFSWLGALIFVAMVGYALVLAGLHWPELTGNISGRVLAAENVLLLIITYPFVKLWHELGHGYAVKKWGGEVHEIGLMFLVFMPVPYVDASDAAGFQNKWQRALVGGVGILVEVFIAALALLIWVEAEDGLLRAFAFNAMLIGGVSTLLFNGNPLLRFDGYYVLSDLLEIPNMGVRSNRYIGYLIQRYAFRLEDAQSPVSARGEAPWLFFYAIASFIYRMFIMFAIAMFVAGRFFFVGVVMAIWSAILMLLLPLVKQIRFLLSSPVLRGRRSFALSITGGVLAVMIAILLFLPLPYYTVTEGVVWTPDESAVFAGSEGTVVQLIAEPNSRVDVDMPLLQLEDPLLDMRVKALQSRESQLQVRYEALQPDDPLEAKILAEQLRHARADLELSRDKQRHLLVRSTHSGRWILPNPQDMEGQLVKKGQILGYVAQLDSPVVRVIVSEDRTELVRNRTERVELRFSDHMGSVFEAVVEREVPALSDMLPSIALSTVGGGEVALDPTDPQQLKVLAKLMHLELRPAQALSVSAIGGRVYVRFDHGYEPIAWRIYRATRQVFMKQLNV